jgi:hypothetical protein
VINCASTYPAVMLRPGHRKHRALGPASLERARACPGGAVAGAVAAEPVAHWLSSRGRQHLLISAKRQRRCRNAPLHNGDRASGGCDSVDLWASPPVHHCSPGLTVRLSARRTMTMQLGDDDASVAWELLRVASVLRSKLVESTFVASSSWMTSGTTWG